MIKYWFYIIILIPAFISPSNICANSANEYELVMSLRYPEACNIEKSKFDQSGVIQLAYTVKLPYPSLKVLKYYDSKLKKLEWQNFDHPYFDNLRKWEPVWDGSIKGMPLTHRLDSYWIDKKQQKVIVLMLEYRSYNIIKEDVFNDIAPNNDTQKVILQIGVYSDLVPPHTKPTEDQ